MPTLRITVADKIAQVSGWPAWYVREGVVVT